MAFLQLLIAILLNSAEESRIHCLNVIIAHLTYKILT